MDLKKIHFSFVIWHIFFIILPLIALYAVHPTSDSTFVFDLSFFVDFAILIFLFWHLVFLWKRGKSIQQIKTATIIYLVVLILWAFIFTLGLMSMIIRNRELLFGVYLYGFMLEVLSIIPLLVGSILVHIGIKKSEQNKQKS